jgi:hypothetical protein
MTTKMTPAEESARFEKFSKDLAAAIYKIAAELALECGKPPLKVTDFASAITDAGLDACIEALDSIE